MKIFSKGTLSWFDWFLVAGILVTNLLYCILRKEMDIIGFIAGVSGLLCVVLTAKRSVSNYIFGIINVSLYAYISYKSALYGDFILNAFYYFPMQFIGWYSWVKNRGGEDSEGNEDESLVKIKRMTARQRALLLFLCVVSVLVTGYLLETYTDDPQPYKDSFTTVLSVIAMYLMVKAFMEQWILWIAINIVGVVMWYMVFRDGGEHAALMIIMWIFYLANSINGYIIWRKNAKYPNLQATRDL